MLGEHLRPGRVEKAMSRTPTTHVDGESDGRVIPTKEANVNVDDGLCTEVLEGRRPTKENTEQPTPPRTRAGLASRARCWVCGKWHEGTSRHGSPRCCITSRSGSCSLE